MTTPDDTYDDQQDPDQQQVPNWRRKLEADAKAGREAVAAAEAAKAEAQAAKRELTMMQLGIDPNAGPGKLFAKAYDGELTADAMRAAAEEFGVLATQQQPDPQQQAMQRIQAATSGGVPSGGAPHDFEAELDSIPMVVDGQYNPDYVNQVLTATQVQASREGREFTTSGGSMKFTRGSGPATQEL